MQSRLKRTKRVLLAVEVFIYFIVAGAILILFNYLL